MNAGWKNFAGRRDWHPGRPLDARCKDLMPFFVQVVHLDGVLRLDTNSFTSAGHNGYLLALQPHPQLRSVVSGEPALLLRTCEAEVTLTPEEVDRLALRALTPAQYDAICTAVGALWEMKEPWYDAETGLARGRLSSRYPLPRAATRPFIMAAAR